jgi:hypothetical protein
VTEFDDATGDWTDGMAPIPAAQADPWRRPEMPRVAHTERSAPIPIRTEGFSIAALWCSIVGVLTVVPAILGIVFGFVARSRIKKSEGSLKGSGLALAGILVGTAVLVLVSGLAVAVTFGAPESDGSLARQELLPAGSYPTGWEPVSGTNVTNMSYYAGEDSALVTQLAHCLGVASLPIDPNPAEAAGRGYFDPHPLLEIGHTPTFGLGVTDTVEVYQTQADAVADVEAAANPRAVLCQFWLLGAGLLSALNRTVGLGPGTRTGPPVVLERRLPIVGDHVADDAFKVPYAYKGSSGVAYNDIVTVQKGRSESVLWFSNLRHPTAMSILTKVASGAASRLDDS